MVGDVTPATILPALEKTFGSWKSEGMAALVADVPNAPQLKSRQVYIVDKPEAAQTQIRIGWVGVPRSTPDYAALQVLNTILGGSFTSRLNQNLRERNGYAYGASSFFDMRLSAGPFLASANVQTDKTGDAVKEFFNELERDSHAGARGGVDQGEELRRARLPERVRNHRRPGAEARRAGRL